MILFVCAPDRGVSCLSVRLSLCPYLCLCVCVVNRELGPRLDAEQKKGLASALGL